MAEHNWFNVTTWALRDWEAALDAYYLEMHLARGWPSREEEARRRLEAARAGYRHRVLSWFWKLCAPIGPGECVPDEVAELLAEEWDLATRHPEPLFVRSSLDYGVRILTGAAKYGDLI